MPPKPAPSSDTRSRRPSVVRLLTLATVILAVCGATRLASATLAAAGPLVHLPADQANHPKVANEWWYVVGHLHSGHRTFGYEVTVFRLNHLSAPGLGAPINIFRTDVAITDESNHRFHQKISYYFPGSAKTSASTLAVKVGKASLSGASPAHMQLSGALPGGNLHLQLSSRKVPMYVGGRGYLPFGNGFTYYYSLTDLKTSGSLRLNGKSYPVSGISWLDHQWGNWRWQSIRGWTWMALQLSNGVQLSVFDFRGTNTRVRAASVLLADGTLRTLPDTSVQSLHTWVSPHTGGKYPSGWVVRIPPLHAVLNVAPTVRDQELSSPGQKVGSYWEGSGRISGTFAGKRVTGLSYTELTGYAAGFTAP